MHRPPPAVGPGRRALAAFAGSRLGRLATLGWLLTVGPMAALAYLTTIDTAGATGPVGGAVFVAGLCLVATVARNASAEAVREGSVRRGSLVRAALFGATAHGGLLAAATIFSESGFVVAVWVLVGAVPVVLTRPATLASLGVVVPADDDAEHRADVLPGDPGDVLAGDLAPSSDQMSTPQILGELREGAAAVRATLDPARKTALAERRRALIDALVARDPQLLALLLDVDPEHPAPLDRPQHPDAA